MGYRHLRVYQAASQLRLEVDEILVEIKTDRRGAVKNAAEHLNEAVDSITNNIAEGNDSIYPKKKATFFDTAAGSVREARSSLESLVRRSAITGRRAFRAIGLTIVITKMLSEMLRPE